jgi:hypothetical protein
LAEAFQGPVVEAYYIQAIREIVQRLQEMASPEVRVANTQDLVDSLAHQYLLESVEEDLQRQPEAVEDSGLVRVFLIPRRYNA